MAYDLNWSVAKALGWQSGVKTVNVWYCGTSTPIASPQQQTVYFDPDGNTHLTLPGWSHDDKLAQSLVDSLTPQEKVEFGKLYLGMGWLEPDEPHSVRICKAWVAFMCEP